MTSIYHCGCHTIMADAPVASSRHTISGGDGRHDARGKNEHKTGAIREFGNKL
jgi:hypothetical protein